jgi:hypothetical protein
MAVMPRLIASPAVRVSPTANTPLRKCTFRRVSVTERPRELPVYDVACTFPDRKMAIPLGDIEAARPVCDSCTYQGIFRADSD